MNTLTWLSTIYPVILQKLFSRGHGRAPSRADCFSREGGQIFSPQMVSVALFSQMHRVTQSVPATFKSETEQGHGSGERGRKKKQAAQ